MYKTRSQSIKIIFLGIMTPLYLLIALAIQGTLVICDEEVTSAEVTSTEATMAAAEADPITIPESTSREDLVKPDMGPIADDPHAAKIDFLDMFFGANRNFQPGSSAAMMAHITESDKGPEEQIEAIKEMADEFSTVINKELANLLTYAVANCDKGENTSMRKKRSAESPMDSTKMVMRLLNHIKSNNEYQNIAIEKMMTAQEIAQKFGIEFNPDPEILTDMAFASNKQAEELNDILKESVNYQNQTEEVTFVPVQNEPANDQAYYVYAVPEIEIQPIVEFMPPPPRHHHHHHHHQPETQIVPPPVHHQAPPQSQRPVYGPMGPMPQPSMDYFPQCHPFEPVTTTTTIILPIEEPVELEPELVGEEYEETVTSKVIVDHDEPGAATVNHVMTYTLSEKAHFRQPEVESLPQQMQYYFFL